MHSACSQITDDGSQCLERKKSANLLADIGPELRKEIAMTLLPLAQVSITTLTDQNAV